METPDLSLDTAEKNAIERALIYATGNISKTAKLLKISRATLQRKIDMYGIPREGKKVTNA